jgi:dTDP-4-amino-4,6-dideoxygalactose transaminase
VTTNDEKIARTIRMLRDHGQAQKYYHQMEGFNGRLDALQAGFLTTKLRHLAQWNRKRQEAARQYDQALAAVDGVVVPFCPDYARSVYHLYVIRVRERDALQKHLAKSGIGTGIHYPVPLHLQEAYRNLQYPTGSFPVCERVASEILSLPMYPQLRADQIQRVVEEVASFLSSGRTSVTTAQAQPVAL